MNTTFVTIAHDPRESASVPMEVAHVIGFLYAAIDPKARKLLDNVTFSVGRADDFPEYRNLAYCEEKRPPAIVVAPKLRLRLVPNIIGVMAHEIGHAFLLMNRAPDHTERECDKVAELLFDCTIGYDSQNVQTYNAGRRPRPSGLPR
jgi:hypothetical protein